MSESARVLCSGGLLSVCEWTRSIDTEIDEDITIVAPGACAFLRAVDNILDVASRGTLPTTFDIDRAIRSKFRRVQSGFSFIPVGDWKQEYAPEKIGDRHRKILIAYASSMRSFLGQYLAPHYVEKLIAGFIADLRSENRIVSSYYVAHGERV